MTCKLKQEKLTIDCLHSALFCMVCSFGRSWIETESTFSLLTRFLFKKKMFRNPSLFRHFHSVMKRSVTVEKVEVVKKAKVIKKKVWEPFDPSLPNNLKFPTSFDFPPKPEKSIKFASYNVASLPACIKKGFNSYVTAEDADVLCIQETKLNSPLTTAVDPKVYPYQYWSFHDKKGYGTYRDI